MSCVPGANFFLESLKLLWLEALRDLLLFLLIVLRAEDARSRLPWLFRRCGTFEILLKSELRSPNLPDA